MGGEMWLASAPGKGSTFSFTIDTSLDLAEMDRR
jgi:signal transduction histidine kinase